jgi:hypothetical protein
MMAVAHVHRGRIQAQGGTGVKIVEETRLKGCIDELNRIHF